MILTGMTRIASLVACLGLATAMPAASAPIGDLHYLVGSWACTYHAGSTSTTYAAVYSYDRGGRTLRESSSFTGGGDEELIAYDPLHHTWTAVVIEDQGSTTIMHASGSDPNHIAYRSVYPDANLAERFDRVSDAEYTIHARFTAGGKTTASADRCVRTAR